MTGLTGAGLVRFMSLLSNPTRSLAEQREVLPPRTNCIRVLLTHNPDRLGDVTQIVSDPTREQLAHRDAAEFRMRTTEQKLFGSQVHPGKRFEILFAQRFELAQQISDGLTFRPFKLCEAIEWLEGPRLSVLENHPCARHPVGLLSVNQVPEHIERRPRVRAFVRE